jgi:prepilin signal peptidase PulO-like enzyme (type II secretory pathway)
VDIGNVEGRHVWIVLEGKGEDRKQDPTPKLVNDLRRKGVGKVRVTPKVPFILSLTIGFALQIVFGNLIFALMFLF